MVSSEMTAMDEPTEPQPQRSSSPEGGDDPIGGVKKTAIRKRTKTGCLTCRKRRIKCDEGRPTCSNCLKSKRQCEGYNQRVIFKDPLGAFAGSPYGPIHYPGPSSHALMREQQLSVAQQKSSAHPLQMLAPKPPTTGFHPLHGAQFSHMYPAQPGSAVSAVVRFHPNHYNVQPAPSKYTFFPPTTIDAFSQNQLRREQPASNLNQFSPIVAEDAPHFGSHGATQSSSPLENGKSIAGIDPLPRAVQANNEDWGYTELLEDESMAESEAEMDMLPSQLLLDESAIVMPGFRQPQAYYGTQTRTFSAWATENVLETYDPTPASSPLNDEQIALVFRHFINVTGPSISLYERHPSDPSPIFEGQPVSSARQHIWTYTFPVMSLTHPALLHSILAIASLQIAKLQGVTPMASLKHYGLALRRIAKNAALPARRIQVSNLAATLILSFYEVWNSDHDKWSMHLLGARWILKEIPLSEMTRSMMAVKLRQRQRQMEQRVTNEFGVYTADDASSPLHKDWDAIDVNLLSSITGKQLSYDDYGMLPEEMSSYRRPKKSFTDKDVERYAQFSDLYWWYCKMDVYQSILGGTRLFMEYDKWTQCPPRAPIGKLDAPYATYDHLILLLGRLSNFASRDLARKRESLQTKGPPPGAPPGGPPPGMFIGMMPASEKVTMPRGFSPPREPTPDEIPGIPEADLDTRTAEAIREWEEIRRAFETLRAHLGPEFEPLGPDVYPEEPTPFGLAARYRTYSIAGCWMNYLMGLIVLHRSHPTMPPVAMLAAGLSAKTTAPCAMEIGRIAAGLEENITRLEVVSTLMASALIESSFPLFVAGIQFRDDPQRHWLVRRLHDIARLTGWQSAHQVADGCETAWIKTAAMGRGPPYHRSPEVDADPRIPVWGNPRFISRRIQEVIKKENEENDDEYRNGEQGGVNGQGFQCVRTGEKKEKKKLVLAKGEQALYAMGLLAVEQELERLDLREDR